MEYYNSKCLKLNSEKRKVPEKISKQLWKWWWLASALRFFHFLLVFSTIASSLLVASKINSFQPVQIEWLAFTAALSTGLLSGFDLGSKANRMRTAWRKLYAATILFEEEPKTTLEYIVNTYKEAEEIIGDVKEKP